MIPTRFLLRQPMIQFLGKRSNLPKQSTDHTPHPHPASPSSDLPNSFATYRQKAQQHGPLQSNFNTSFAASSAHGKIGGTPGAALGAVEPEIGKGVFFDRSELPKRFARTAFSAEEMEAVESGGASMWG
ncbi:MAG: hypothetical protein M1831_006648 [Alyxoria varia]|nr:MAG: hypothetical protein M1831_006648 [Alyxoria varia]